jgi:hypothetical protein
MIDMNRLLLLILLMLMLSVVTLGQRKETSVFTVTISRTGATTDEAMQRLTDALGAFAEQLSGSADIHQRNSDGSVIVDGAGKPLYDRAKVEKRIVSFFDGAVDDADVAARAFTRKAAAVAVIEQEERDAIKDRKPIATEGSIKEAQPESFGFEIREEPKVTPRKRFPIRRIFRRP